nr:hypothetical protein [Tanacetum cinerariifolium]
SSCKGFGHIHEECPKNTGDGEKKTVKNPSQNMLSNTPIGEKIDKIERQIYEGKLRLLDNDGNLLVSTGIVVSDSEVEVVFDGTANLRISTSGKDGSDKGPFEPLEDDSPVDEVVAVKPKRKYTRRRQPIKKDDKEFVEPWTIEEEVVLCKAWVHVSENSVKENAKKAAWFWTEVTEYFHTEMSEQKRS